MVANASVVWLAGALPGMAEIGVQLMGRGYAVRDESQHGSKQTQETPDAAVYFAPPPPAQLSMSDVPGHTARVVAEYVALAKRTAKLMARERRAGALVAVCDVAGIPGRQGRVAEATASGALLGAVKCLAKELGRQNISVNALCYGFIPALGAADSLTPAERKLFDMMRLGKSGSLEHLVDNLAHLIANRHFMTGQVLHADDGLIM